VIDAAYQLAPDARVWVDYEDRSPIGGPVSAKLQETMRRWCAPIAAAFKRHGAAYVVENGPHLLRKMFDGPEFDGNRHGAGRLPRRLVHVDPATIKPAAVVIESGGTGRTLSLEFDPTASREIHDAVASLATGGFQPGRRGLGDIGRTLAAADLIEKADGRRVRWRGTDATFLGHNAVVVRSDRSCVLVDPWLVPARRADDTYRPIPRSLLANVDAIAITHSHPDHFDPGSLLQFDRRTRILVPRVGRESLLAVDMAYRLGELGFQDVRELDWGSTVKVGDILVTALPFYGEQPTTGPQLFPEARNCGNTYLIRTPRFSCGLVADSGQDRGGRSRDVAREAHLRWGPIDVLFSGYRGWTLYPVQFFESSVRQYLLFVPEDLWGVRQSIMNTVEEAIDTAEIWHARYLVPYGDGGAPWYGDIGLGPRFGDAGPERDEWEGFDALPERVLHALSNRTMPVPGVRAGSSVKALLMRPGDNIRLRGSRVQVTRMAPYAWPWTEVTV
jgi:L-ascorbate metabolism protein UlaG (beta-lactamase superfamily)